MVTEMVFGIAVGLILLAVIFTVFIKKGIKHEKQESSF